MNRLSRVIQWLAGLCLVWLQAWAQDGGRGIPSLTEAYVLRSWEKERESHYPAIASLAQTQDGFLWLGTYSDLTRFDGMRFFPFPPQWLDPSLGGAVLSLYAQSPDLLWVGTDNGIVQLGASGWVVYGADKGMPRGLVFSLLADRRGQMLAVRDARIHRLEADRWVEERLEDRWQVGAFRLVEGSTGDIHAWNSRFILRRGEEGGWREVLEVAPGQTLKGVGASARTGLWVADEGSVRRWADGKVLETRPRPEGFRGDNVQVYEDAEGLLWLGCYSQGLVVLGPEGPRWKATSRDGLPNISITQLLRDREGNLWLGSNGGGVVQVQRRTFHVYSAGAGLDQTVVNSMAPLGDGSLLVGTHGGGAQVFRDGRFGDPLPLDGGSVRKWVQAVVSDGQGGAWLGTVGDGLFRWSGGRVVRRIAAAEFGSPNVDGLFLDSKGQLWIGGNTSTAIVDGDRVRILGQDDGVPPGMRTMGIEEGLDGSHWLLLDGVGLLRRRVGGRFEPVPVPMAPQGAPVSRIYVDLRGALWLGSTLGPVGRWKEHGMRWMTPDDGVPVGGVFSMADDGVGGLWIGGPDAIGRMTFASVDAFEAGRTNRLERWRFGRADGVPVPNGREFMFPNSLRGSDGRVWFATLDGLAVADPLRMRGHRTNAPPLFESIGLVNGAEEVIWGRSAGVRRVGAGTHDLQIRYTAPQLGDPEQTEFQFRIRDGEWMDGSPERQIQMVDLKAGEHRVELRSRLALDPDWSEPVVLHFEVDWFWWERPVVRWAFGVVLAGLLGAGTGLWVRRWLLRRRAELERALEFERVGQERDAAAAANRAKTEFIAMISHELRTPLHGLLGYSDLLMGTPLSRLQTDYVQRSRHSAESLLRVINEVLDYSRLEAGRMDLEAEEFDLRGKVAESLELLGATASKAKLRFLCRVDPTLPARVRGDGQRLHQVLMNLVGNALKFTKEGHVWVRVDRVGGTAEMVEFRVIDTGIGIAAADMPRLFKRFSQADASTTRRYGGTGLGLAICKGIVERMGGTIGCESSPGQGSIFWFRVPLPGGGDAAEPGDRGRVGFTGAVALVGLDEMETDIVEAWVPPGPGRNVGRFADVAAAETWLREPGIGVEGGVTVLLGHGLAQGDLRFAIRSLRAAVRRGSPRVILVAPSWMPQSEVAIPGLGCDLVWSDPMLRPPVAVADWASIAQEPVPESMPGTPRGMEGTRNSGRPETSRRGAVPESWAESGTLPGSGRYRVLLVEDHPVNQAYARDALSGLGCQVDLANNGQEAVEKARAGRYDLILMDCQMPVKDGWEATREIRAQERPGERVFIAALTAGAYDGDRTRCLEAGMDDFLAKPFRIAELKGLIERRRREG